MTNPYPINTGNADYQRLEILNRIYNPVAMEFLKQNGLMPGMKVLEIGCGFGQMAQELAQTVGPAGKVIAVDNSEQQLRIAAKLAEEKGITNIEFKLLDIRDLNKINEKFDLTYGRWIMEFVPNPASVLEALYNLLNPQGILTYESGSFLENGNFSYPHQPIVDQWFQLAPNYLSSINLEINFANSLYHRFKQLQCKNIALKTHQPILITAEEKSVLRLGSINTRQTMLKHYSDAEFEKFLSDITALEQKDVIIGFFRNILIKGNK